jgi:hypothetical protein
MTSDLFTPVAWRGLPSLQRRDSSRRFRRTKRVVGQTPRYVGQNPWLARLPLDPPRRQHPNEQGSALLIVFVLAAAIAIMLYRELPVAITEGQRQREQLLIDRGGQYERAIQLYFRSRKTYPPSLDALESTNNMRFLRRRYVDPFTGKADWRLLHMGPAGPIDSLVNPINPSAAGNAPTGFGAPSSNASSQTSSDSASSQTGAASGAPGAQSAAASGADASGALPGVTQPQFGLQPDTSPYPMRRAPAANAASMQRQAGDQSDPNALPPLPGDGSQPPGSNTGQPQSNDPTQAGNQAQGGAGQPGNGTGQNQNAGGAANGGQAGTGTGPGTAAGMASQILLSPGPQMTPGQQSQSNPFGGGSIGGVASTVKGHSIKIVNDQRDRAKWEFVYDYRKDTGGSAASSAQNAGQTTQSAIGGGAVGGFSSPSGSANNGTAAATTTPSNSGSQTPPNQ